jgi:hypothetical protein
MAPILAVMEISSRRREDRARGPPGDLLDDLERVPRIAEIIR